MGKTALLWAVDPSDTTLSGQTAQQAHLARLGAPVSSLTPRTRPVLAWLHIALGRSRGCFRPRRRTSCRQYRG
jgi:hypothetical protein